MANLDLYKATLAPWQGSVYDKFANDPSKNQTYWSNYLPYDSSQFDPNFSVKLMDHYNQSMGLGLTDQQIVDGINAFAQRSSQQWNEPRPLDASSNPVAVAAESIERALALAGKDSGAFWKVAEPMLSQGQVMAEQMEKYTRDITEQKFVADENRKLAKDNGGFGGVIDKFAPMVFSAIAGPAGGLLATAAQGAGKGQDFGDILKSLGMSAAGTLIGGGGLDSFTNGTALGNFMTGAGNAAAGTAGSISDLLGESTGQGFTPIPGVEQTVTSSLPSSGIGAGLGGLGTSLGTAGGNMDWLDELLGSLSGDSSGGNWLDAIQGITNTGQSTPIPGIGGLESLTGNADWDALFGQAIGEGTSLTGSTASSGIMDWLTKQAASDPIGKASQLLKAITGTGAAAGGLLGNNGGNILGALLGAGLGSIDGSKQAGTINTTQTPWGPQQPYLLDAWEKAKQASGNPINTQAQSNYQSVLSGPTSNPMLGLDNPYLTKQIDNANSDVTRAMMPAMNQANKASGSFGNSGVADIYSKNMLDAYSRNANDIRYKDYYGQQQLQKDAVNNTLGFTQGSSAFNAAPSQDYAKTVQGSYGGTKSEPYFTNQTNSILGGATLGSQLGKLWG